MDNLTHSLVGAALAEAGPRDRFALATPTLILAANVPDADAVAYLIADEFVSLAWRRGLTHGVPALLVWPFVVVLLILAWDRWVRRRRDPRARPARFLPLLGLAAIGALTHPALDWLNNYGVRWWLPFDGRWSYGDAVFIIDPWLWLALGGVVFLARSRRRAALVAWAVLALLTSLLVLATGAAPAGARIAWVAALGGLALLRWLDPLAEDPARRRRFARFALAGAAAYIAGMVTLSAVAEREVRAAAAAARLGAVDVMAAARPAAPTWREVVIASPDGYRFGEWRWGRAPRYRQDERLIPRRFGPDDVLDQALDHPDTRNFLVWSRYPYLHATEADGGWRVRVGDARYADREFAEFELRIDR